MTSISTNVYIYKLPDIIKKYNNPYHKTIKTKLTDVKSTTYIDLKFEVGGHVRISKYKHIFTKDYTPN